MKIRKATVFYTFTAVALAVSATTVMAASNDLYSAEELMDADVYLASSQEQVGEVEDVLFDNSLAVRSFVIETNEILGLGGEAYVVSADDVRVATVKEEDDDPEYRVTLDATIENLKAYPEYSDSWWDNARAQAGDAWSQIKDTTSDLVDGQ